MIISHLQSFKLEHNIFAGVWLTIYILVTGLLGFCSYLSGKFLNMSFALQFVKHSKITDYTNFRVCDSSKIWYVCQRQLQVIKDSMEISLRHRDTITLIQIEKPLFLNCIDLRITTLHLGLSCLPLRDLKALISCLHSLRRSSSKNRVEINLMWISMKSLCEHSH